MKRYEIHAVLAQRFEVSKSPVREALQDLVRDGLVVVTPRQGYRASSVSMSDAHDMFAFRHVLEVAGIAESVKLASDADLARLDRFRAFSEDGWRDFVDYNCEFHCELARCSGNGRMSKATCDLIEEMDRLVRLSVSVVRGRDPQKLVEEHGQIIDAVQARNARTAVALLKAHMSAAERRYITALEWAAVKA
jgi:DNA-binding GntR family transcriptional regulator